MLTLSTAYNPDIFNVSEDFQFSSLEELLGAREDFIDVDLYDRIVDADSKFLQAGEEGFGEMIANFFEAIFTAIERLLEQIFGSSGGSGGGSSSSGTATVASDNPSKIKKEKTILERIDEAIKNKNGNDTFELTGDVITSTTLKDSVYKVQEAFIKYKVEIIKSVSSLERDFNFLIEKINNPISDVNTFKETIGIGKSKKLGTRKVDYFGKFLNNLFRNEIIGSGAHAVKAGQQYSQLDWFYEKWNISFIKSGTKVSLLKAKDFFINLLDLRSTSLANDKKTDQELREKKKTIKNFLKEVKKIQNTNLFFTDTLSDKDKTNITKDFKIFSKSLRGAFLRFLRILKTYHNLTGTMRKMINSSESTMMKDVRTFFKDDSLKQDKATESMISIYRKLGGE